MKIILGGRYKGKTTELIKMSNEHWAYIVCFSQARASEIAAHARVLNLDIPFPISFYEFMKGHFARGPHMKLLIDDAECLIQACAKGADVLALSITDDDSVERL
jgi:hypothetical protein